MGFEPIAGNHAWEATGVLSLFLSNINTSRNISLVFLLRVARQEQPSSRKISRQNRSYFICLHLGKWVALQAVGNMAGAWRGISYIL